MTVIAISKETRNRSAKVSITTRVFLIGRRTLRLLFAFLYCHGNDLHPKQGCNVPD